jgi:predicted metal-dependent phosphoesterase TrpH
MNEPAGLRCDLHVHSIKSGRVNLPILGHLGNECYSEPRAVYERCRTRGMDLVTLTDHDTLAGGFAIAHLPEVFLSEEVTLELGPDRTLHVGALDITEAQHERLAVLRHDPEALFAYCAEERIPLAANHLFARLDGGRETDDFLRLLRGVSLVETLNGMARLEVNHQAEVTSEIWDLPAVGGSDAHTLASVARAYTLVPGARSRQEFTDGLRRGWVVPKGRAGSYANLTADVLRILAGALDETWREAHSDKRAALRLAALALAAACVPFVPLIVGLRLLSEGRFAAAHFNRLRSTLGVDLRFGGMRSAGRWEIGRAHV